MILEKCENRDTNIEHKEVLTVCHWNNQHQTTSQVSAAALRLIKALFPITKKMLYHVNAMTGESIITYIHATFQSEHYNGFIRFNFFVHENVRNYLRGFKKNLCSPDFLKQPRIER